MAVRGRRGDGLDFVATFLNSIADWALALVRKRESNDDRHPSRIKILRLIEGRPSITLQEIEEALQLNRGTASHHLRRLAQQGLIATVRAGRETHFFLSDQWPQDHHELALLSRETCYEIISAIKQDPLINQKSIIGRMASSRKVCRENLDLLKQRDLLREDAGTRNHHYGTTPKLERLWPRLAWRKKNQQPDHDLPRGEAIGRDR